MCVTCLLSRERIPKTAVSNWMNFWWNEECVRKQFHATSFWGIVGSLYTQIHASPMLFICSTLTLSTRILVSKWMQKTKWWCLNVWLQCKRKQKWDLKKELTHFMLTTQKPENEAKDVHAGIMCFYMRNKRVRKERRNNSRAETCGGR